MLTLAARAERFGRSSLTMAFLVLRGEALLADIRTIYVNAKKEGRAGAPLPGRLFPAPADLPEGRGENPRDRDGD